MRIFRLMVRHVLILSFGLAAAGFSPLTAEQPNGTRATQNAKAAPQRVRTPQPMGVGHAMRPAMPQFQQRQSENPARFVFSAKPKNGEAAVYGDDPSARAIWSTFLTGNISPEIVRWHIEQRRDHEAAERSLAAIPSQEQSERIRQELRNQKRSEYEKMLRRTEFSLTAIGRDKNQATAPNAEPSSGSIAMRLLTGHRNDEMRQWKNTPNEYLTAQNSVPAPFFDSSSPSFSAVSWPNESEYAAAVRSPTEPQTIASPARPIASSAVQRRELIDDEFPAVIRPVSASIAKPSDLQNDLPTEEPATRPSRMKVWRAKPTPHEENGSANAVAAQPLPSDEGQSATSGSGQRNAECGRQSGRSADEGWSPVE